MNMIFHNRKLKELVYRAEITERATKEIITRLAAR